MNLAFGPAREDFLYYSCINKGDSWCIILAKNGPGHIIANYDIIDWYNFLEIPGK